MTQHESNLETCSKPVNIGTYTVIASRSTKSAASFFNLSNREAQALKLLSTGATSISVAKEMNVSSHTVDTFKRRLFEKLGVKNMTSATALIVAFYAGAEISPCRSDTLVD